MYYLQFGAKNCHILKKISFNFKKACCMRHGNNLCLSFKLGIFALSLDQREMSFGSVPNH